MPAPITAAKLTSQDPLIIRPIRAGVLLTATADRAVSPTLPAKYMGSPSFSFLSRRHTAFLNVCLPPPLCPSVFMFWLLYKLTECCARITAVYLQ
uniref:Uncharacterized protein n=1 Tax=Amphilophus citrinellus TaxID=61819 RepID=A0A3Q0T3M5_AMPCI